MNRREAIRTMAATFAALFVKTGAGEAAHAKPLMTVYKSPSCGCCARWTEHVRAAGYEIREVFMDDLSAIKKQHGVTAHLESCHTAKVGRHVFEGHVPADLIDRFLRQPPEGARGLAVPGMPLGSPGMEVGGRKDAYDVVLFMNSGARRVYARR